MRRSQVRVLQAAPFSVPSKKWTFFLTSNSTTTTAVVSVSCVLPKHASAFDLPVRWRAAPDGRSASFVDLDPSENKLSLLVHDLAEAFDKQIALGIVKFDGADVVALFRRDGALRKPGVIARRAHDHDMSVS